MLLQVKYVSEFNKNVLYWILPKHGVSNCSIEVLNIVCSKLLYDILHQPSNKTSKIPNRKVSKTPICLILNKGTMWCSVQLVRLSIELIIDFVDRRQCIKYGSIISLQSQINIEMNHFQFIERLNSLYLKMYMDKIFSNV